MVGSATQSQAIGELLLGAQPVLPCCFAACSFVASAGTELHCIACSGMQVQLDGQEVAFVQPGLPEEAQQELEWWDLIAYNLTIIGLVCKMCMHAHIVTRRRL